MKITSDKDKKLMLLSAIRQMKWYPLLVLLIFIIFTILLILSFLLTSDCLIFSASLGLFLGVFCTYLIAWSTKISQAILENQKQNSRLSQLYDLLFLAVMITELIIATDAVLIWVLYPVGDFWVLLLKAILVFLLVILSYLLL